MRKRLLIPEDGPVTGDDIQKWRKHLDWSQRDAAGWLGVSVRALQNWEQGVRNMRHPVGVRRLMAHATAKFKKSAAS